MTKFLNSLFLFAWFLMTNMKPLHVDYCLETRDKKHRILAALPIHRCPLSFCIIIKNGPERNGKTDGHLWKKSDVHVYRSIIPFCRRPKRQRLNSSEFSTVMEQFWTVLLRFRNVSRTEKETSKNAWNIYEWLFNKSSFVKMIFND